jgi:hypothetical protein
VKSFVVNWRQDICGKADWNLKFIIFGQLPLVFSDKGEGKVVPVLF